jgi:plastocyanin
MNRIILGAVVIIILIGAVALFIHGNTNSQSKMQNMNMPSQAQKSSSSAAAKPAGKNAVTIQNFAFSPATVTIKAGQSITWTNEDSIGHSATADSGSFDTGVLSQGQSKTIAFAKAGTYTYHCSVHPNMKATVIVQ